VQATERGIDRQRGGEAGLLLDRPLGDLGCLGTVAEAIDEQHPGHTVDGPHAATISAAGLADPGSAVDVGVDLHCSQITEFGHDLTQRRSLERSWMQPWQDPHRWTLAAEFG
jgi:hypothetical protein